MPVIIILVAILVGKMLAYIIQKNRADRAAKRDKEESTPEQQGN